MAQLIVEWLIPNHVVYAEMHGDIDLGSFQEFNVAMLNYLEGNPNTIHLIVDVSDMKGVTASSRKIRETMTHMSHPSMGWMALYGGSPLVRYMTSLMVKLAQKPIRTFGDFNGCARFLGTIDDTVTVEELLAARQPIA